MNEESVQPKASSSTTSTSGPRTLIANVPASPAVLTALLSLPTPPPSPSPNVKPASPAALVPKLRWANIGWHYHWGNKQYDFTRGKAAVAPVYRDLCSRAVRGVDWEAVYKDVHPEVEWGDEGDWRSWKDTYGAPPSSWADVQSVQSEHTRSYRTRRGNRKLLPVQSRFPVFLPEGIVFNVFRTRSWRTSIVLSCAPHRRLYPYRAHLPDFSSYMSPNFFQARMRCCLFDRRSNSRLDSGAHPPSFGRRRDHVRAMSTSIPR